MEAEEESMMPKVCTAMSCTPADRETGGEDRYKIPRVRDERITEGSEALGRRISGLIFDSK